jgi:hypothetical protein
MWDIGDWKGFKSVLKIRPEIWSLHASASFSLRQQVFFTPIQIYSFSLLFRIIKKVDSTDCPSLREVLGRFSRNFTKFRVAKTKNADFREHFRKTECYFL